MVCRFPGKWCQASVSINHPNCARPQTQYVISLLPSIPIVILELGLLTQCQGRQVGFPS
jgi:hypothetical protein